MHTLCDAAQNETLPRFRVNTVVVNKLDQEFDPVTEGDRKAEEVIRSLINKNYPEHGIIGEEFGAENVEASHVWIIDPIDGTRAFITGIPVWGTLICLAVDGKAELGIMHQPFTGERYYSDGTNSYYLGPGVVARKRLETRGCPSLAEAMMMTTSPNIFAPEEIAAYGRVEAQVRLVRYGCDCYAYSMLAAGQIDLVIESGLNSYDIAALVPIVKDAGGIITDWQGNPVNLLHPGTHQIIAAGCEAIYNEALNLLNE